jgi:hypothetical protein
MSVIMEEERTRMEGWRETAAAGFECGKERQRE